MVKDNYCVGTQYTVPTFKSLVILRLHKVTNQCDCSNSNGRAWKTFEYDETLCFSSEEVFIRYSEILCCASGGEMVIREVLFVMRFRTDSEIG